MGPGRFVSACVIKVILIGEHVRLSIRELLCEMSSNASVGIPKAGSPNFSAVRNQMFSGNLRAAFDVNHVALIRL